MVTVSLQTTTFDRIHDGLPKKHHQNTSCETTASEVLAIPCDPITKPQTGERQCENLQPYSTHLNRTMEVNCKHLILEPSLMFSLKNQMYMCLFFQTPLPWPNMRGCHGLPIWATFKPPSINKLLYHLGCDFRSMCSCCLLTDWSSDAFGMGYHNPSWLGHTLTHMRATTTEELGWIGSVLGSASHFPSGS